MNFPIYGHMPVEWKADTDLGRPARFTNADGTPASDPKWIQWLDALADDLAGFLWPRFSQGTWHGAATAHMSALTLADLALMDTLYDTLEQHPQAVAPTHLSLFLAEDAGPPSTSGFLHYEPAADADLLKHFQPLLLEGGGDIARPASLNLKRRMQRPRPYQAAALHTPTKRFRYRAAASATTPSMVSGHAIQGVMALVNVVVEMEDRLREPMEPRLLGRIQQYFIDTGDRRVFAGVHYPTDNLSSWYAALQLCCRVFNSEAKKARAREVLWDAVSTKSAVYMAIQKAVTDDAASPLAGPLKRLQAQAAATCVQSPPAVDSRPQSPGEAPS